MNIRLIKHLTLAIVCMTVISTDIYGMKRSRDTRDASSTHSINSRRPELIAGSTRDYYRLAERYGITRPTRTPATTPTPTTPTPTSSSEDGALGDGEAFMDPREDGETKQSHSGRHIPHALSLEADAEKNIDLEASAIKKAKLDLEAKAAQEEQTEETKKAASLEEKKEEKEEKSSVIDPALTALRATAGRRARHHASVELGDAKRTEPTAAVIPSTHTESSSLSSSLNLDEREGKGEVSQEEITRRIRAEIKEAYKPLPDLPYQGLDAQDADSEPVLPTPRITATSIPMLIARMQRLLRLGHTPEAIGAAIKASGFNINGIRIGHFKSMRSKCDLIRQCYRDLRSGTWRNCVMMDNGMNALQWAVSHSNMHRGGPGGMTPILPNAAQIIQALLAAGALPSVKVNAGRLFRGDASSNHGLDALQLAFDDHCSQEIIIMILKAHANPVPVIKKVSYCILTTNALSLHGYSAALIRALFACGAITNVNRVITDFAPNSELVCLITNSAPNYELSCIGVPVEHRDTPITPICLKRWVHIGRDYGSHIPHSEADLEVISVLAEYGANPDPIWSQPGASDNDRIALQAWLRGREVWKNKQSQIAARPILTALTYGDLDPVGDGQRFDPAITSQSEEITSPATPILPTAIANIIVDMI